MAERVKKTIVFLHGWGHNKSMWETFANNFSAHNTICLDLPGFGKEKLVSDSWDIKDYANWTAGRLQQLKLNNIIIVGHSFGGKVAAQIVLDHPTLAKKIVLIAAPLLRRPSFNTKIRIQFYKLLKEWLPKNQFRKLLNQDYTKSGILSSIYKNSVEYDITKKINEIKIPTLIIWGSQDEAADLSIGKEMHKLIPNSKLKIIKRTGHNIYLENPNILYGLINKFINDK